MEFGFDARTEEYRKRLTARPACWCSRLPG
jgi:hypothetical protein